MKKLLALLLTLSLLLALSAPALAAETPVFTDVPADAWYADAVRKLAERGVVHGVGDGLFAPDKSLSYAELAMMTCNMLGVDTAVDEGEDWWAKAVAYCVAQGCMQPVDDPTAIISREAAADFLYRAFREQLELTKRRTDFPDRDDVDPAYREAVELLYGSDILRGTDAEGTFLPGKVFTRAEFSTVFERMAERIDALAAQKVTEAGSYYDPAPAPEPDPEPDPEPEPVTVGKPQWKGQLTYTGAPLAPTDAVYWIGYDTETMTIALTAETEAGTYDAVFTLTDGYAWTGGSSEPCAVDWTIDRAKVSLPVQNGTLTANGDPLTPEWTGYAPDQMTVNVTPQTEPGDYTATFTPTKNYCWTDGGTNARTANWTILAPGTAAKPAQNGTLTYTGKAQSPDWTGYDKAKMTLGGVTSGTNAGSYAARFTLKEGYSWTDGSFAPIDVQWTIGKADTALTLKQGDTAVTADTTLFLSVDTESCALTVGKGVYDGTVDVFSSDTTVASAALNAAGQAVVSTENGKDGVAEITVSLKDTNNCNAASLKFRVVACYHYLLFQSTRGGAFTLHTVNEAKNWDGTLEASTDCKTWTEWDGAASVQSSDSGTLFLRGTGNGHITGVIGSNGPQRWVLTAEEGETIAAVGSIETLLDYETVAANGHPAMDANCFFDLFYDCTALCSLPSLPAADLSEGCYRGMFSGCTGLTAIPEDYLPATTMAPHCYSAMFSQCTGLTTLPDGLLPATALANYCYDEMFYLCSNLSSVPALPATTLADHCYYGMFWSCAVTSLSETALPATTLARCCYSNMFYHCTELTAIPEKLLPVKTLAQYCYATMFAGCTGLTALPANLLPAETAAEACYQRMFKDCTGLTALPAGLLPATTLASSCYDSMFFGCTGLTGPTALPANLLPAEAAAEKCYIDMFSGCTGLTQIPAGFLNAGTLAKSCCERMFYGCTGLTALPSGLLPAGTAAQMCYKEMFKGCTGLTALPAGLLPATTLARSCYERMFYGCTGLTGPNALPANLLPAEAAAEQCYMEMFRNCTGLTALPADLLPATTLASECYSAMFYGCTGLTALPANLLPAATLAEDCYFDMFDSCTGLTQIPAGFLPAGTLAEDCYGCMFFECTGLTALPANLLPATTLAVGCYSGMFNCCSGLTALPQDLLPATTLAVDCYFMMFSCTGLTELPEHLLPATTLANECYSEMFYGCTGLTEAHVSLPAVELHHSCYKEMFSGCTNLTVPPQLPEVANNPGNSLVCAGMFAGCSKLKFSAAQTGEYSERFYVPYSNVEDSLTDMFAGTGGTFTGTPTSFTTYYYPAPPSCFEVVCSQHARAVEHQWDLNVSLKHSAWHGSTKQELTIVFSSAVQFVSIEGNCGQLTSWDNSPQLTFDLDLVFSSDEDKTFRIVVRDLSGNGLQVTSIAVTDTEKVYP